jgi:hypothetical protein
MTLNSMTDMAIRGQCQVDVTDEIPGENVPSLGNFFAATPPSNPSPVDDALAVERAADDTRAVERAEWWLFNDCPDAGDDRFASAVEAAAVLRDSYRLSSSLAEAQLNDIWNRVACEPPLTPFEIAEAVRQAYCWQATPVPSTAAEEAEQPDDVSPPSLIVETTTPSSLTASPSAVTATSPVPTTERALCAARRKVKRERTRRWRARMRNATQPARTAMEAIDVR